MNSKQVMRGLVKVWTDFDSSLSSVPLIDKLERKKFRIEDYRMLLINHRQQVVEGSRWIARAASSISAPYLDQRSMFLRHAVTEHRDYKMLEDNYVAAGGKRKDIQTAEKNIGSEALHAFMYQRASEPNPFDLLGAMFIIEGLGERKAGTWGRMIQKQLKLDDDAVSFLVYHGEHDEDHMQQFADTLESGILELPDMGKKIVKTAKIVARLYRLQLEELGNI
ncbi:MAG: 3-oxoacyl-ACP synthase [Pseudomonadota bacterium]|nr:3-oxoacyl-ACP synthase [Pseudomonadota bacterium]QKK04948.1 MAG: 3-oxoacyl-ACP synthase [Pseudomonadota bacterium]